MSNPFVSIIIPVLNGQKALTECLTAVCGQDYDNYEIIVVDNRSTDRTKRIIQSFQEKDGRVKYVFEPVRRRGAARYAGEQCAQGEIILMTDVDCLVAPDWIRTMIAPIVSEQQVAVQGDVKPQNINNYWSQQYQEEKDRIVRERLHDKKIGLLDTANFAIRADVLKKCGYTNPQLDYGNDTELMIKLLLQGYSIFFIPKVVLHHNPESAYEVFKKNFSRGFWEVRVRRMCREHEHLFIPWDRESDRLFWRGLDAELKAKGSRADYVLVTGVSWRIGGFWGKFFK